VSIGLVDFKGFFRQITLVRELQIQVCMYVAPDARGTFNLWEEDETIMMKKFGLTTLALVCLCGMAPSAAWSATIDVTYNLSGGMTVVGASAGNLTPGAVVLGTATFRYNSTSPSPGSIIAGPAVLQTFSFAQNFALTNVLGNTGATLTGAVGAIFSAGQSGALSGGGGLLFTGLTGFQPLPVHCNAAACAALGAAGLTSVNFSAGTGIAGFSMFGPGHLGAAPGSISLLVPQFTNFITVPITMTITGTEVSRTFVPEPGTGMLVALGLFGIAGSSSLRRWRR
jgi:hypothetical protein